MSSNKIVILLIGFSLLFLSLNKQADIEQIIHVQSNILKDSLTSKLNFEKLYLERFFLPEKINIRAYPAYSIKPIPKNQDVTVNEEILKLEVGINHYEISTESKNYYLSNVPLDKDFHNVRNLLKTSSPFKEQLLFAEERSKTVFLLYVAGKPVVGYFDNDGIKLVDSDLRRFDSLNELIMYRFGSLETFNSEVQRIEVEKQYLNSVKTFDQAKKVFINDQSNFKRYHIYNPTALSNAVIYQVEEFCEITDYQRDALKKELNRTIQEYELGKKDIDTLSTSQSTYYSYLFEYSIKNTLFDILYYDQKCNYLANEFLFRELSGKAESIVLRYYENERNIEFDSIGIWIRKELF
jgi:hypothetical protein